MKISKSVNYRNFGFIPTGRLLDDIKGKLYGFPNLYKRLQAKDIFSALDLCSTDQVLDFGCGMGFYTVEMSKLSLQATGIDINPLIERIPIPPELTGKLRYIKTSGNNLPFSDGQFDKVLASEVLPMIDSPNIFLAEIYRVMKPKGRLVIANSSGHPTIQAMYLKGGKIKSLLKRRYENQFPPTYEEYERILQKSFGTSQQHFLKEHDLTELLHSSGFKIINFSYSPRFLAGCFFSWSQFLLYLRSGKTLSQRNFLLYYILLSLLSSFDRHDHKGGIICSAEKV